ncbi:enoyl-CoA hydratase/isomerase family protein [Streptomyces longispororuber]|uniref:enoyl-CoA hydratase/isomerase family protein n=1 Tax=Streptomyces longispororuber TaxID=68230 RepID=UPI00210992DF|nr:enoyl-CoA hydratase/isomerase family protein [Streptomyces longispororuber]MCQ4207455.1 enoyl-CoA hydratase/isomerase family protein [Streptomyces longispororuber]
MTGSETPVLRRVEGRAAHLVLNRPRALNAIDHEMVRLVDAALTDWEHDDSVESVVITGAGERGLCAGGDIRAVHDDARDGDGSASAAFWRDEYHLNARIARYPKPYVAIMDGIVMGGGVGISAHGSVRVVTERSRIAMPETGIGFVPDVGGTWLLAHAPGELGTYLALTGASIGAGDALLCGLADHYLPASDVPGLLDALATSPVRDALSAREQAAPDGELAAMRPWIDACFAADTVEEIVARLLDRGDTEAKEAAELLLSRSPLALKVTLAAMRSARGLTLEEALDQEYRVSCVAVGNPDLVEGVRAQIIDKDRRPRWQPAHLAEVTDADVRRHFVSLGERELGLA